MSGMSGCGGAEVAAAGVTLRQNYTDYNVMGISAVLLNLRRIFVLLDDLTRLMEEERPDVLVIIDYPDFNWRLAARAKERGIPVFSYIPPSAWAWRKGRAKSCAALADEIVAIFPHELPPYEAAGANISFVGNPLIDTVRAEMEPEEACRHFGIEENDVPILLMPGSRREEIERLEAVTAENPKAREAQRVLAHEVCTWVHGAGATAQAEAATSALWGRGDLADIDEATILAATADLASGDVTVGQTTIVDLLVGTGLERGRNAARKTIAGGGAYINNVKVADETAVIGPEHLLAGGVVLVRKGRRNLAVGRAA